MNFANYFQDHFSLFETAQKIIEKQPDNYRRE